MKLAIKGHATRGKEVIEILEMLGGRNVRNYACNLTDYAYSINGQGIIDWYIPHPNSPLVIFTLEKFLEKFPYKIGDRVRVPEYESDVRISNMRWDGYDVQYEVVTDEVEWYSAKELYEFFNEPYKEETMESKPNLLQQLKEYFDNTPRDVLEKEWNELSYLNEIGPTIDEYLECVKKYRQQNQYPKTYEECCKALMGKTDFQDYSLLLTKLSTKINEANSISPDPPHITLINNFYKLLICRDAYWKIAGEQMGLGEPWKPDWLNTEQDKFVLYTHNNVICLNRFVLGHNVLAFPTAEMRDAFLENFKELINETKELL